jgi:hypothetical protein
MARSQMAETCAKNIVDFLERGAGDHLIVKTEKKETIPTKVETKDEEPETSVPAKKIDCFSSTYSIEKVKEFFNKFLLGQSKLKSGKGEYETTEEYNARKAKTTDSDSTKIYYFDIPYNTKYNADKSLLKIFLKYNKYSKSISLDAELKNEGTYTAKNGYGTEVEVAKKSLDVYELGINSIPSRLKQNDDICIELTLSPAEAKEIIENKYLKAVIATKFKSYNDFKMDLFKKEAKFNDPEEVKYYTNLIQGEIKEIYLYDTNKCKELSNIKFD